MSLFPLGRIVATKAALAAINRDQIDIGVLLGRHVSGDWGELSCQDRQANQEALSSGSRIFSSYAYPSGKIWVITEADRSSTCILLPQDY